MKSLVIWGTVPCSLISPVYPIGPVDVYIMNPYAPGTEWST
jgi:hypothetical protein